jgi:hypothetical protein
LITIVICLRSSRVWVSNIGYSGFDIVIVVVIVIATAIVIGNAYRIKNYNLLKCVRDYIRVCLYKDKPSSHYISQKWPKSR